MVDVIPANPRLMRKALNFRRGQPLQPTPEVVSKLQQAISATQNDILVDFLDRIRDLRELFGETEQPLAGLNGLMERARDQILEIKGLGQMIGYPLLTDYAASLDNFLRDIGQVDATQMKFVSLGIDAIYYVLRHKVSGMGGAVEREVSEALRAGVPRLKHRKSRRAVGRSTQVWQSIAKNTARLEKAMKGLEPEPEVGADVAPAEVPAIAPAFSRPTGEGAAKPAPKWQYLSHKEELAKATQVKEGEASEVPESAAVWDADAVRAAARAKADPQEAAKRAPVIPAGADTPPKRTERSWLK